MPLTDPDRARINAAVAAAEAKTEAEIVPVVAAASGRYDRAEDLVGVWLGLMAMSVVWLLWPDHPVRPGSWGGPWRLWELLALLVAFLLGFTAGTALASRFWILRRPFVTHRQIHEEVESKARQVFYDRRVHHTAGGSGLLIYVSLFERHASIFADQAVLDRLGEPALKELCDGLTTSLRSGSLTDALCRTIEAAGERLATALPRSGEPRNELPDAVVLLG
jgi:putative membrane protein